ncbi:permease [Halioxenophilus aromaticivorans]|uniref:ATPase n=1 Tax=Halioxenophilus aromaticivorans TaxID=1306992 RepID=A0AAV3U3J1_9ALTE
MRRSKSCCAHHPAPTEAGEETSHQHACCGPVNLAAKPHENDCCAPSHNRIDWLLWGSVVAVVVGYVSYAFSLVGGHGSSWQATAAHSVYELINTMWFSVILAIVFVGVLSQVPQSLVMSVLGRGGSVNGLARATVAGVMMDLCSHGILMVAMKLYQKGASLGQTMAFLVASPWNSFSLTLILFALIGWQWTLAFIVLSMLLAFSTGWIFDRLVAAKILPGNPCTASVEEASRPLLAQVKTHWQNANWDRQLALTILKEGLSGARIVLRWLLFGVVLASLIRALIDPDVFQQYLGPSALGLAVTLVAATVIEVCSEGSAPIAADIMNRTSAPGNGFAFLMTGVATDYTEVMVIKDTMQSWKVALFLPLVTLPQVIVVAAVLNQL